MESAHRHLIRRIKTHLAIRGSSDFPNQAAYQEFIDQVCAGANSLRAAKVAEEIARLRPLPAHRYPETEQIGVSVTSGATVRVKQQTYSVPSRLIGLELDAHVSETRSASLEGHEVASCRGCRNRCIDFATSSLGWRGKPAPFAATLPE